MRACRFNGKRSSQLAGCGIHFEIERDEIRSPSRGRAVACTWAVISSVAIDQMGFSGADVARALDLTPSTVSKPVLRVRNDPALKKEVNKVLNLF